MRNFFIIGYGNIGKEHHKAIIKIDVKKTIWVYDKKFQNSYYDKNLRTYYINFIPSKKNIDLLILSCLAKDRFRMTLEFLKKNKTKYTLFEKFVFQNSHELKKFIKSKFYKKKNMFVNSWGLTLLEMIKFKKSKKKINIDIMVPKKNYLNNLAHFFEIFRNLNNSKKIKFNQNLIKNVKNIDGKFSICEGHLICESDNLLMNIKTRKIINNDIIIQMLEDDFIRYKINLTENFKVIVNSFKKNKVTKKELEFPKVIQTTSSLVNWILKKKKKIFLPSLHDHSLIAEKLLKNFEKINSNILFK